MLYLLTPPLLLTCSVLQRLSIVFFSQTQSNPVLCWPSGWLHRLRAGRWKHFRQPLCTQAAAATVVAVKAVVCQHQAVHLSLYRRYPQALCLQFSRHAKCSASAAGAMPKLVCFYVRRHWQTLQGLQTQTCMGERRPLVGASRGDPGQSANTSTLRQCFRCACNG